MPEFPNKNWTFKETMNNIKKTKYIDGNSIIIIKDIKFDEKRPWYYVDIKKIAVFSPCDDINYLDLGVGWINSTSLFGQKLKIYV